MSSDHRLFSIGHSNHSLERFIELLRAAGITAVADVRSSPFSQWLPQFNRQELAAELKLHNIAYWFLGNLLGGRPSEMNLYDDDGRVNYERVRSTAPFKAGLDRLSEESKVHKIAMLCAEEDPLDCHRGLMITPALLERGIATLHLRCDGSAESTEAMEDRLLIETKVGVGVMDGLFAAVVSVEDRREMLAEAYRQKAKRKAFRRRNDSKDEDTPG